MKVYRSIIVSVVSALLFGCGGGGGSTTTTPTPATATFSTAKFASLTTGDTLGFNLSGTDTAGGVYSGTTQNIVDGPATVDGRSVTQKRVLLTLTKAGANVMSVIETYYYNADRSIYKVTFSNGVTATPTNTFAYPLSVKIGDFGAGIALSYSNGNSLTSTWQVLDGGNGNVKLQVSTNINSNVSDASTVYINSIGVVTSTTEVIYNFPTTGVNTTLNGTPM